MALRRLAAGLLIMMLSACMRPPAPPPVAPPPPPGSSPAEVAFRTQETECLAQAVYFEARGESVAGRRAVAAVIMNRVGHARFPETVCGVIRQGGEEPPCQFSWWCDGKAEAVNEPEAWADAQKIAAEMYDRRHPDPTGGALYFHQRSASPGWKNTFRRTAEIDNHLYYRPNSDDEI